MKVLLFVFILLSLNACETPLSFSLKPRTEKLELVNSNVIDRVIKDGDIYSVYNTKTYFDSDKLNLQCRPQLKLEYQLFKIDENGKMLDSFTLKNPYLYLLPFGTNEFIELKSTLVNINSLSKKVIIYNEKFNIKQNYTLNLEPYIKNKALVRHVSSIRFVKKQSDSKYTIIGILSDGTPQNNIEFVAEIENQKIVAYNELEPRSNYIFMSRLILENNKEISYFTSINENGKYLIKQMKYVLGSGELNTINEFTAMEALYNSFSAHLIENDKIIFIPQYVTNENQYAIYDSKTGLQSIKNFKFDNGITNVYSIINTYSFENKIFMELALEYDGLRYIAEYDEGISKVLYKKNTKASQISFRKINGQIEMVEFGTEKLPKNKENTNIYIHKSLNEIKVLPFLNGVKHGYGCRN